jgi:hypothetical protein
MSLDENMDYDTEVIDLYSREHPHITDDGKITQEGTQFIIAEFGRLYGESPAEAMKFYSKINRKAKKIIEREYFLH